MRLDFVGVKDLFDAFELDEILIHMTSWLG
jgi:hypothetical protein